MHDLLTSRSCYNPSRCDAQVDQMTDVFVRAFTGDVSNLALVGGNWTLADDMYRSRIRATLLAGEVYVVTSGPSSEIVSVGLWFAPGTAIFATEEERSEGFNDFIAKLSPEGQAWLKRTCATGLAALDQESFTPEDKARMWWCSGLVTRPDYQGRGHATAIMDRVYTKAASQGEFVGLMTATDANVPIYLHMGFIVRASAPMASPVRDFTVYYLSKE
ncbi:hypothetical protein OF83DRAFT_1114488 [Amylostereum chailletii]|nr:hypothetical protein OF83DRAFT_1114488 [Amylostereum chailletii]